MKQKIIARLSTRAGGLTKIQNYRLDKELSLKQMAKVMGINYKTVFSAERRNPVSQLTAVKISKAFGKPMEELFVISARE